MPTYDYKCLDCENSQEEFHSMSETPTLKCAKCGSSKMKKMIGGGSGIHFKGSGFYVTDYKDKPAKSEAKKD